MLERLSRYLYKAGCGMCVIIYGTMLVSMILQVFFRYGLGSPLLWPEELTKILMIWLAFIGSSLGVRKGSYVYFSIVIDRLSGRIRRIFGFLSWICLLTFAIVSLIFSVRVILATSGVSPTLNIPYFLPKLGMLIGFGFIFLHAFYFNCAYLIQLIELPNGKSERITKIRLLIGEELRFHNERT